MRLGLLVLVTLALASAGCMGGGKELSQGEAESRVAAALDSLPQTFSSDPQSDDLRKLTMEAEGGASETGPFALGDVTMLAEWGRDDVLHVEITSASGAITFAFEVFCGPDGVVMVFGGESYGSRPSVAEDPCSEFEPSDEVDEGDGMDDDFEDDFGEDEGLGDFFDWATLDPEDADVTPHDDGTVTAVFTDDKGTTTLELDSKGRLTHLEFEGEGTSAGASATMDLDYGPRQDIDIPEADHLVPATLETEETFDDATHTLVVEVTDSPEEPQLDEMEVRVLDGFDGPTIAAFPLDRSSGSSSGIEFRFTDADGDDKLSVGDSYSLASASWEWEYDVDQVVWDVAADGAVNSTPLGMPGPGLAGLGLALLIAGLAARRLA